MIIKVKNPLKYFIASCLISLGWIGFASAQLAGQFGILDLEANGGINPNTGNAWADGDQYRLAFYSEGAIDGTSNDPAVYDAFATAQANLSTLGNGDIASSTGWTALVWVNTDPLQAQGSALSDPAARAGITDTSGGQGIGGAGVPVFAMDGKTSIARNNAVIMSNAWKSPFGDVDSGWGPNGVAADSAVRLPVGVAGMTSTNTQTVHYSPFLNQFGAGDSGAQHGLNLITGGFPGNHINAVGAALDDVSYSWGSSNANNTGRVWNRFTEQNLANARGVYAISQPLTVQAVGGAGFRITGITHDSGADMVTLSWTARAGSQYTVYYSRNPDKLQAGEFGDGDVGDSFEDNDAGDVDLDPAEGMITIEISYPDTEALDLFFSVHEN